MKLLTDRYQAKLLGVLSCYDRMILTAPLARRVLCGLVFTSSEFHQTLRNLGNDALASEG